MLYFYMKGQATAPPFFYFWRALVMFEMVVTIRRSDPKALIDDFNAVTALLERRGTERSSTSDEAVRAAERLLSRNDHRRT